MKASKIYGMRTQIAWAMLMVAVSTSVLGNIVWGLMVTYYNQNPANSLADILYLLFIASS